MSIKKQIRLGSDVKDFGSPTHINGRMQDGLSGHRLFTRRSEDGLTLDRPRRAPHPAADVCRRASSRRLLHAAMRQNRIAMLIKKTQSDKDARCWCAEGCTLLDYINAVSFDWFRVF